MSISFSNILESGLGALISTILVLGAGWLVKIRNQPNRDGDELKIKGVRLTEEKSGKIFVVSNPYELKYDVCWRHSFHRNVDYRDFSNHGIIPIIVRDYQSKYVIVLYKEHRDPKGNDPRFRILNLKETKMLYKFASGKSDISEVSEMLLNRSAHIESNFNWNEKERQILKEVLEIFLKYRNKLN